MQRRQTSHIICLVSVILSLSQLPAPSSLVILTLPTVQVRIAELLGVAGTDVPIAEIEKLIPPYKVSLIGPTWPDLTWPDLTLFLQLGVNGYSFAVNNNGYILYHPDLRPMVRFPDKLNYTLIFLIINFLTTIRQFLYKFIYSHS